MIRAFFVGGPLNEHMYELQYLQHAVEIPILNSIITIPKFQEDAKPLEHKTGKYEIERDESGVPVIAAYRYIWKGEV